MRGSDGEVRSKGKERKWESKPVVKHGVKHMECTMRRCIVVRMTVGAVGGAEGKEGERWLLSGDKVEEGRRRESSIETLADAFGNDDFTEG